MSWRCAATAFLLEFQAVHQAEHGDSPANTTGPRKAASSWEYLDEVLNQHISEHDIYKIHLEHWGQGLGMFGGINLQEIKEMVVGIQWELGLSKPPIDSSGKPGSNTSEGITFLAGNFRHPPIPALTFPMYNIDSGKPWTNKLCIQRRSVFGRRTFGPTLSKRQCDEATLNSRRAKVEELLYLGWWRWVQYPKKSVGNQQVLWCACCLEFQLLRCASLSYRRWIIQNYYRGPWFGD